MKTKAVRLYGKNDLRLEEYELPEIKDDEILVRVVTDSICMSTWKAVIQGEEHKRVPANIATNPIIIGHEFAGDIVKVGARWKDKFHEGAKFAQQPAIPGQLESPGYSYEHFGGACTYCIFPSDVIEKGCIWEFTGDAYYLASLGEPMSCCIGGYHSNYHGEHLTYDHIMGTKEGGDICILGGCGPMGLGAVTYGLAFKNKPRSITVVDVDNEKIQRAQKLIPPAEAEARGITLKYVNSAEMSDPVGELKALTKDGAGFSDVFVYAPIRPVAELGNQILGFDGCMNFFAGPTDKKFSAEINLYDCHYGRTHILGSTGGNNDDMKEAIQLSAEGKINPSVMVTHVGGIDSIASSTSDLPNIPGGKKLTYTQIDMPLTAIDDFAKLGESDPMFKALAEICEQNNGLWNAQAENYLLNYKNSV